MLKRSILFQLLFIISGSSILLSQSKTEQHIAALEQRRFEAMTQQDIPFLKKVLTENVTYAHSNGLVENKTQHLENVRTGNITYEEMKVEKSDIRIYKKAAVVNGIINVKGLYKGHPFDVRLGFTDVYVKQKRKWKLAAWQSVKLE